MAQTMRRDIGELLVQGRVITADQLAQARESSSKTGKDLESVFVSDFGVKPFNILQAKAHIAGLRAVDLSKNPPEAGAINLITPQVAQRHKCVPITKRTENGRDVIYVAMADASNIMALDDIQASSKLKPIAVLALPEQIDQLISQHYAAVVPAAQESSNGQSAPATAHEESVDFGAMIKEYGGTDVAAGDEASAAQEDEAVQGPIIRIAHAIIQNAVKDSASDIHIEPSARNVRVRYRIDGVLHEVMTMPKHIHPPLISRYKIMAEMNIAERRIPQDGRIGISLAATGKDYDLRVSCLPTLNGEKIVMRILDKGNVMVGLNRLGFFPDTMAMLESLITQPNGMFLATGPTGAGKSTTMYSVLNRINSVERNIMTVEDPVEYQLPGVSQVAVLRKAGLTFATALRSFMRQDPDIIMVGEIRDLETAEMAIQASLTGHLVLSTLHTNDAPSSVTRLVDMGVEPFLVSATMIGALAQRLGRRICENCKEEYDAPASTLIPLGHKPEDENEMVQLWRGRGCDVCRHTGYKGRIGIYELMKVNEEISELMVRRAPVSEIKNAARANGMKTLQDDGLRKLLAGITTPEEIQRVVFTGGH